MLIPFLLRIALIASCFFVPVLAPSDATAQYTHRLTRIVYDFDNNGLPDAERDFVYDGLGVLMSTDYTYTGDGTPDLLNTEDDGTVQEDTTFGYDASGRVDVADVVRPTESFETDTTFVADEYDRIDVVERNAGGTIVDDSFIDFTYTSGDMTLAEVRDTATTTLINQLVIAYGSNNLPEDTDSISAGISIFNTLSWNTKGDITFIDSMASGGFGSGTGTFTYRTSGTGQLDNEVWTQTGFVGSLFSDLPGFAYRKTYAYDGNELRTSESVDRDDDGSVEAVLTFEWEAGVCNPSFGWAPNGPPNFSTTQIDPSVVPVPYVPGTGAFYLENCGPFPVPEPSFPTMLAVMAVGAATLVGSSPRRSAPRARR